MTDAACADSPRSLFDFAVPEHVALVEVRSEDEAPPSLHPAEEAILHPRAVASRRNDVRRGRAAAHAALRRIGADSGPILRGAQREPLWPPGVVGSIAHASGVAVAAVAHSAECGGLGVDVEHLDRYFTGLPATIAIDDELAWIGGLAPEEQARATLEVFSAKEAIYKAFFPRVQRFFGFETVSVKPRQPGVLEARFVEVVDPTYPATPIVVQRRWAGALVATLVVLPPHRTKSASPAG